jgi:hypothetical protein
MVSDDVADCIVYHNGYFSFNVKQHGKEYTTLQTLQIQVLGEIHTQEVVSTENFDSIWRTKLFSIFGYEEGAGLLKNQGFR